MLGSLFGDLNPPPRLAGDDSRAPHAARRAEATGPDATAGTLALSEDVVVDASPAAAIRRHFAEHRADLNRASAMLTLLDPSRLWATQVVHALSEAAGQPVQRLNLRERATLRTLAVIERTLVPRRDGDALRVYHADIRASAMEQALAQDEIGNALAEGSQLTAVIVGAMQPHALLALLRSLLQATRQPEWRCPHLVFILPPGAAALRQRIVEQHWPPQVQVSAAAEPTAGTASVWNCVLEAWESCQASPPHGGGGAGLTTTQASATAQPGFTGPAVPVPPWRAALPPQQWLSLLLAPLAASEGLLACGIVDLARGDLLASQSRERTACDLAALALALCAMRQTHPPVVSPQVAPDEILITAGPHQTLLRTLPLGGTNAALGFVALLDRHLTHLPLLRFKLLEAEQRLA